MALSTCSSSSSYTNNNNEDWLNNGPVVNWPDHLNKLVGGTQQPPVMVMPKPQPMMFKQFSGQFTDNYDVAISSSCATTHQCQQYYPYQSYCGKPTTTKTNGSSSHWHPSHQHQHQQHQQPCVVKRVTFCAAVAAAAAATAFWWWTPLLWSLSLIWVHCLSERAESAWKRMPKIDEQDQRPWLNQHKSRKHNNYAMICCHFKLDEVGIKPILTGTVNRSKSKNIRTRKSAKDKEGQSTLYY